MSILGSRCGGSRRSKERKNTASRPIDCARWKDERWMHKGMCKRKRKKPPNPATRPMISQTPRRVLTTPRDGGGKKTDEDVRQTKRRNLPPNHFQCKNAGRYDARCHPCQVTTLSTTVGSHRLLRLPLYVYRSRVVRRPAALGLGLVEVRRHALGCGLVMRKTGVPRGQCATPAHRRLVSLRLPGQNIETLGAPVLGVPAVKPVSSLPSCNLRPWCGCGLPYLLRVSFRAKRASHAAHLWFFNLRCTYAHWDQRSTS